MRSNHKIDKTLKIGGEEYEEMMTPKNDVFQRLSFNEKSKKEVQFKSFTEVNDVKVKDF